MLRTQKSGLVDNENSKLANMDTTVMMHGSVKSESVLNPSVLVPS